MPTFDAPEPITATIDVAVGDVRINANDSGAAVVHVRPSDPSDDDDVKAARLTRVEHANAQLLVKAPRPPWLTRGGGGSIDVTIELPSGSRVHGAGQSADFRSAGRLGECRITTGLGNIRLDRTDALTLRTGVGEISVERATGHAEVTSGSGEVRLRELEATGVIRNSNGDTWVGSAGGDVRLSAANGSITVERANAGVVAKTANGDIGLGEAVRGSVVLETRIGDVELGIREGTAAWLDLSATAGRVHNALDPGEAPDPPVETVEVRARTSVGEIAIRRSRRATREAQPAHAEHR